MPKTTNPLTHKRGLSVNVILTAIVVVVAVLVIGGVLLLNRSGNGTGATTESLRKPDSHVLLQAPNNKVTVVEFLDYQCPACWQYYRGLTSKIEKDYAGRITFVTRNFPLTDAHPLAQSAAQAAEAAGMQGKYAEMYHKLYDNYQEWALAPDGQKPSGDKQKALAAFQRYAQEIGLDMTKYQQDFDSPAVKDKIAADVADGQKANVSGTPTIFINGKQFQPNAQTYGELENAFRTQIDQELAK
jgi:protein-disulfide isomerase